MTLIEAADVPLAHVLGPRLGGWFADLHRAEGVRVELGVSSPTRVRRWPARRCRSSSSPTGARSPPTWCSSASASRRRRAGSPARRWRATASPSTTAPAPWSRTSTRRATSTGGQHWEPAARLGAAAARSILGLPVAPAPPASFWSDQYGVRIHLVGEAGARASRSTADPRRATSPLCCAATGRSSAPCSSAARVSFPAGAAGLPSPSRKGTPHDPAAPRRRVRLLRSRRLRRDRPGRLPRRRDRRGDRDPGRTSSSSRPPAPARRWRSRSSTPTPASRSISETVGAWSGSRRATPPGYDAPIGLTADPVVFTLLDGRLSVLLARRFEEPQRGMFALPGGFVGHRRVARADRRAQAAREDRRRLGAPRAAAHLRRPAARPARLAPLDRLHGARRARGAARGGPEPAASRAGTRSTTCRSSPSTTR